MSRDPTEALTSISLLHCCGKDRTNHQRREACRSSRRRHAAAVDPARHAGIDRHKVWLRRGCLRCLHGVGERPGGAIVPDPCSAAAGRNFTTIEGLSPNGSHPCQRAWLTEEVAQCGYCQAGMTMTACALLQENPNPSGEQIDHVMSDSVCRCGTSPRMRNAIRRAAEEMSAKNQ